MNPKKPDRRSILVPFLMVVVLILAFGAGSLWQKVKTFEKGGTTTTTTTTTAPGQEASKLSLDNLKKYAKDLKLDTKKFDTCLDNSSKKEEVSKEAGEGQAEGVSGTPAFFLNGHLITGALPFEMFKTLIDYELKTGFDSGQTYPDEVQKLVEQGYLSKEKKEVTLGNAPSKGPKNAKITLVEYSDFECPYCSKVYPTINQIMEAYPNDIKLVFKQFPLSFHANAQKAAEASLCAYEQGKFWEYYDKLFGSASN